MAGHPGSRQPHLPETVTGTRKGRGLWAQIPMLRALLWENRSYILTQPAVANLIPFYMNTSENRSSCTSLKIRCFDQMSSFQSSDFERLRLANDDKAWPASSCNPRTYKLKERWIKHQNGSDWKLMLPVKVLYRLPKSQVQLWPRQREQQNTH